jgi:hypothetical protein
MKSRNSMAMLTTAGLLVAGAAMASPADARGYFGFSIAAPGYFDPPVVVDARLPGAYTPPYYGQPAYQGSYYDAPSYEAEGGQYYFTGPSYFGAFFHASRIESYHRANFRNEERGHQSQRSNGNGRRGYHR